MKRRLRHDTEYAADRRTGPRHQWRHEEGAWRCRVCATWTLGADVPDRRRRELCTGPAADGAGLRALGHRPCRATGAFPFTFCSRCGAWSARRSSKMSKPCAPPTQAGLQALRRIERGQHPWRRKERGGAEKPRGRASSSRRSTTFQMEHGGAPRRHWLTILGREQFRRAARLALLRSLFLYMTMH